MGYPIRVPHIDISEVENEEEFSSEESEISKKILDSNKETESVESDDLVEESEQQE